MSDVEASLARNLYLLLSSKYWNLYLIVPLSQVNASYKGSLIYIFSWNVNNTFINVIWLPQSFVG